MGRLTVSQFLAVAVRAVVESLVVTAIVFALSWVATCGDVTWP